MTLYNERDLNETIKKKIYNNIYIFEGAEVYMQQYFAKKILTAIMPDYENDINYIVFEDEKFSCNDLINSAKSISFSLSDKKVIIVKNLDFSALPKQELTELTAFLNIEQDDYIIIFYNTKPVKAINSTTKKLFTNAKIIYSYFSIKTETELARLINSFCGKKNITITPNATKKLILYCSSDLLDIINELEKLCLYVNIGIIDEDVIEKLVNKKTEISIYLITKNLQTLNLNAALSTLNTLLANKIEATYIISVISSIYYDLLIAKIASGGRHSSNTIAEDFGYAKNTTFRIKNALNSSEKYSLSDLKDIINILINADLQLKSTKISNEQILQNAILKIFTEVINAKNKSNNNSRR